MGQAASHPELLDWLASEFRDNGMSLKKQHRLIVTSSTYRQQSRHDPKFAEVDVDNRLLWRMNRTRLDAEQLRDSILLISGRLDRTPGGPSDRQFDLKPGIQRHTARGLRQVRTGTGRRATAAASIGSSSARCPIRWSIVWTAPTRRN